MLLYFIKFENSTIGDNHDYIMVMRSHVILDGIISDLDDMDEDNKDRLIITWSKISEEDYRLLEEYEDEFGNEYGIYPEKIDDIIKNAYKIAESN